MGTIKKLYQGQLVGGSGGAGQEVYPVTSTLGVYDTDNNQLQGVLNKLTTNLELFTCGTSAATAAKAVSASKFVLMEGGSVKIKFTYANSAASPTLAIGTTAAKPIIYNGAEANASNSWEAGEVVEFYYDGTNWVGRTTTPAAKEQLSQLGQEVANISEVSNNLIELQDATKTVNALNVVTYATGRITIQGTASGSGGRTAKLCTPFTLPAGTYEVVFSKTPSITVFVENSSGNAIIKSGAGVFTLSADTNVYIGINTTKDSIYDDDFGIAIFAGQDNQRYAPTITAKDTLARTMIDEMDGEVEAIKAKMETFSFIPDALYPGYIDASGNWQDVGVAGRYYKVIPIEGALSVVLVGGTNASAYRFLTAHTPVTGQNTGIIQGIGGALNANATVVAQVPEGTKYLYIQWLSGTDRSPAEILVDGVNFYTTTREQILSNARVITSIDANLKETESQTIKASFYSGFLRGTLTNGNYIALDYRVCSSDIMCYVMPLVLKSVTGFRFGVQVFVNGVFSYDSGWKTSYTIPANTCFKIVIARTTDVTEEADIDLFVDSVIINDGESAISMLYGAMLPDWDIPGVGKKKVSETTGTQGLTRVGDIYIQFNASNDAHTNVASLYRYTGDFESMANMSHNFGHAASADYDAESDCLIIGNGSGDTSVLPRMDIVQGAKAKILAGGTLSYSGEDVIHIELNAETKELGGSGLICCYGGNWRVVYLATGQGTAPRRIFKCVLGVGEEDFSDQTAGQTDATAWGTFISGKSNTEYNGTLKVLSVHTGPETGTYQGICFRAGFIYLACGVSEPLVHKIRLTSDSFKIVQTNQPLDYNADGTKKTCEPEGLCFVDGNTMLVGLPAYGGLYTIDAF